MAITNYPKIVQPILTQTKHGGDVSCLRGFLEPHAGSGGIQTHIGAIGIATCQAVLGGGISLGRLFEQEGAYGLVANLSRLRLPGLQHSGLEIVESPG